MNEAKNLNTYHKKKYKISIILPSFNVVKYIDECIKSALNQTLDAKEIICIDAGSTDGTWEILLSYANNPQFRNQITLIHSGIKSYGYQVNQGIRRACGEYIAILETDDYISKDMYKYLYELGVSNNADYVKADFDYFVTYSNNKKIFNTVALFKNDDEKYEKVLNPSTNSYLYACDYNIWKGIYKKSFLLTHHILLNESKGAAYQDIGFVLQVLSCASRGVYCKKSFYRYRMDREESSINSEYGLEYSHQEFARLLEVDELKKKMSYSDGFFRRMAQVFCGEIVRTLRAVNYNVDSIFIKPHYLWFKEQISKALNSKLLSINLNQLYPNLLPILDNIYDFSLKLENEDLVQKKRNKQLLETIHEKNIIIFGLGIFGESIIHYLYKHNINILAACDNNTAMWNTQKYGLKVFSPLECVKKFPDCIYVIANKKSSLEIYQQLINLGINQTNIFIYS